MTTIEDLDKKILNNIQLDFPIDPRPYKIIAKKLNIDEEELVLRIQNLKDRNIIRRIGGNFSPHKIGYFSTLCAAKVDENKIDLFTKTVNSYNGVTHNYIREHDYNIWFTFIAPSTKIIKEKLLEISQKTNIKTILNLPATIVFKISANFKL